jgi:hypothetical protein
MQCRLPGRVRFGHCESFRKFHDEKRHNLCPLTKTRLKLLPNRRTLTIDMFDRVRFCFSDASVEVLRSRTAINPTHKFIIYLSRFSDNTSLETTTSTFSYIINIKIMTLSTQDAPTTTIANGSAMEIPSNFICPITLQVMVNPVMTRTGLNFERAAIFSWLEQGSGTCPLTRKPLAASDLITNRRLKTHIRIWRGNNGIPEPDEEMAAAECKFVGFLKISGDKKKEILARHSQQPMTLKSLRTNIPNRIIPPPSSTQRPARSSRYARQSGERRRNFLSRILTSATTELDEL